jgi:GGDEF domain-containing protein
MLAFSTEELQTVLLQLDQAIYNHEQWSKGLDRTLICKSHCDQRDVSPEAHRQCQFGQWYYTYASAKLQQLPAFVAIEAEHARMHQLAARLLMAVAAGKTISPYEYDNFAQTLERLRLQLHTLKRELSEQLYNRDPLTQGTGAKGLLSRADGTTIQVTASFGVAELDPNLPVEATLDRADKALYAVKGAGRNCTRAWDPAM